LEPQTENKKRQSQEGGLVGKPQEKKKTTIVGHPEKGLNNKRKSVK